MQNGGGDDGDGGGGASSLSLMASSLRKYQLQVSATHMARNLQMEQLHKIISMYFIEHRYTHAKNMAIHATTGIEHFFSIDRYFTNEAHRFFRQILCLSVFCVCVCVHVLCEYGLISASITLFVFLSFINICKCERGKYIILDDLNMRMLSYVIDSFEMICTFIFR